MISSGAGLIGIYGYSAYCASKFALHGFAQALRSEAHAHGVGVSVCFPPDTETPQFQREFASRPAEAAKIMGTVRPWPADAVAKTIARGIDRGRFEVYFGTTLFLLGRFAPAIRPCSTGGSTGQSRVAATPRCIMVECRSDGPDSACTTKR